VPGAEVLEAPAAICRSTRCRRRRAARRRCRDGIRYVEVVDGNGKHIASGMGDAADALSELILYLLPQDHDDYPKG
jgi:hypothetical protein